MIGDLKPYAEYKETGSKWLGQAPSHWSLSRIKTVLRETDRRSDDGSGTLLSLTRVRGLIPHREMTEKVHSAKTLAGYKRYKAGQLVMNRMQAWSGMFGFGPTDGLVSPDYAVFDVLGGHGINFVLERLKSPDLVGQFAIESKGIGSGFNRLYTDRFGAISISLPSPDEQAALVRFLDWANARLERAIRAKRKVIGLLDEQKKLIIHRAVTLGLDPSAPLKPSSVVGVGGIPKHWEERQLRTLTTEAITNGVGESAQAFRKDWPRYVRITDIGNTFALRDSTRASLPPSLAEGAVLRAGDLLIAAVGATFGKAYVHTQNEEACFAGYLVRVRLGQMLDPLFAGYWTESQHYWTQLRANVIQSTIQNFSAARVKRLIAVVPPIAEQASIVAFASEETSDLNILISRLEREIQLLREYRTRLVADVVTGKLDVREAAARLPDEVPLGTLEDTADLGVDLDNADEEAVV